MVASVPELTRRTCSSEGSASTSSFASCTSPGVGAPKLVPWRARSAIAAITAECA